MGHIMFRSRDPKYRSPLGAVKLGEKVHFRISPPRDLGCRAAYIVVHCDGKPAKVEGMFWSGMNGKSHEWWECHFAPETDGVYFYSFELHTDRGTHHIYKSEGGIGVLDTFATSWQLTVYDEKYQAPSWLNGGIMYQIFPDRFNFSGERKSDIPKDRTIREKWGELPEWKPNSEGEITNSDYFMGDLKGIRKKLRYIKKLGVNCIYLNPIFEAHSNHRYNTANYMKIDPLLGTTEDFVSLCKKAKSMGIHIILDGVFSHTGSDSIYFNRENRYSSIGAYNSKESPYYNWFDFKNWPDEYESWWGFYTLPNTIEHNEDFLEYICGENGVISHWIKKGADGWRLDVVDELPDIILEKIYKSAKATKKDAIVLGEVWEDASNKFAYGKRREYLLGNQMDTVMNYPFATAIIDYINGGKASYCMECIENIVENYPPNSLHLLMNHLGTHDTERILSIFGGPPLSGRDREWQSKQSLSRTQKASAVIKLKLASILQYFLPGVPCIYYGDEAGLDGYRDPFNRKCYPWDSPDNSLIEWYKGLGKLRNSLSILKTSSLRNVYSKDHIMCFERYQTNERGKEEIVLVVINRSEDTVEVPIYLDHPKHLAGSHYKEDFKLPPFGFGIFSLKKPAKYKVYNPE